LSVSVAATSPSIAALVHASRDGVMASGRGPDPSVLHRIRVALHAARDKLEHVAGRLAGDAVVSRRGSQYIKASCASLAALLVSKVRHRPRVVQGLMVYFSELICLSHEPLIVQAICKPGQLVLFGMMRFYYATSNAPYD
jgi:hypothetical protein